MRDNPATVAAFWHTKGGVAVAQERLSMRKIREILRLRAAGFTDQEVAASIGCARSTVQECLRCPSYDLI
jgi:DNA-binding NarL/FixJ family response regulator